jgi:hypothetical protein
VHSEGARLQGFVRERALAFTHFMNQSALAPVL